MRLFTLITLCFMTFSGFGQNNPILSKVTATWCSNCGIWGWEYMQSMKAEFATGPGVVLGVHNSGDLQNPTSVWYANNLNAFGQPRFYVNNSVISVTPSNIDERVADAKQMTDDFINNGLDIISFDGISLSDSEISATINISELPITGNDIHVAVYVYENNVENNQATRGISMHPNVLRTALGATATDVDNDGILVDAEGFFTFFGTMNDSWVENELGLLAVVYEKVGDTYEIRSSQSVSNIALKLDTEELLPQESYSITDKGTNLEIATNLDEEMTVTFYSMTGQALTSKSFYNTTSIAKSNLPTGMYVAQLRSKNASVSQQVFIK